MEFEIVELEEKLVEGIGMKTTNEAGKSIKDIGELWQNFFAKGVYDKIVVTLPCFSDFLLKILPF